MIEPKISIILITWDPAKKDYLDICIRSLANLDYPKDRLDIILVGRPGYNPRYDNMGLTITNVHPDRQDRFFTPTSLNVGAEWAASDSKYIMDLNDDCILTKNSLRKMVDCAEGLNGNYAVNPISQCEHGMFYSFYQTARLDPWYGDMKQYMRMDDVIGREDYFLKADSPAVGWVAMDFLCMYATLIPMRAWKAVKNGTTPDSIGFDEQFKTGQDDVDYSKRLRASGFGLAICPSAVVWHFGGVTSTSSISRDFRRENVIYFRKKWGEWPPGMTDESVKREFGI